MAARRRKVHSTPFPPGGENCVRSLAPPLPGEPASLGFAGSNEGLGKAPPGHLPLTGGVGPGPHYGGTPSWEVVHHFRRAKSEWPSKFPPGHWALGLQKLPPVRFHSCAWVSQPTAPVQILAGRSGTGPYKNNAAAPLSRRRGGSETARKAFPWGKADSPCQGEMAEGQKG